MQARPERVESNPALAGEVCGVTGAAQQLLHLARPVFLFDLDQGLEFTQVMGVAQGMRHARHRVIGLPVVMQAHDILPKNSRLKLSFNIRIIPGLENASLSYDESFMRVASTF